MAIIMYTHMCKCDYLHNVTSVYMYLLTYANIHTRPITYTVGGVIRSWQKVSTFKLKIYNIQQLC